MLSTLITSRTRIKLLTKFFVSASNSGYLRGMAKEFDESTNAIRKELSNLTEAGYLELIEDKSHKKLYKANRKHPLFSAIQNIVLKELGMDNIVASILERMGGVKQIAVVGDYARGIDSGEIEVVVVGDHLKTQYIKRLSKKLEHEIKRKVLFLLTSDSLKKGLILYDIDAETKK